MITRSSLTITAALLAALLAAFSLNAAAEVCVTDDRDREVCLDQPAERIIALSPGATELAWAAGAGDAVVGVVSYSDYPEAAKSVPSVGSHTRVDMEKLLSLKPDLILAWATGNPKEQTDRLQELDQTLYFTEPRDFESIATNLERIATLSGTEAAGKARAKSFRAGVEDLRERYSDAAPVPVFYQVWDEPLMTINGEHFIHNVVELCGGRNVFADLDRLVPRIDWESVLAKDPEAIVAGGMGEENRDWLTAWEQFESLTATSRGNLFFVPPSTIQRPTPRLLEGGRTLCRKLETARERR